MYYGGSDHDQQNVEIAKSVITLDWGKEERSRTSGTRVHESGCS